jgi:peptide deformylase
MEGSLSMKQMRFTKIIRLKMIKSKGIDFSQVVF